VAVGPTCLSRLILATASLTSTFALAVLPVPPFVDVTVTELFLVPVVVPCTFTEKVHDAPAAKLASLKLTVPEPAVAVIVPPPQEPDKPLGVATMSPPGRVSVKATPVKGVVRFGLLIEKLRLVVFPVSMYVDPKDFAMTGGAITVSEEVP